MGYRNKFNVEIINMFVEFFRWVSDFMLNIYVIRICIFDILEIVYIIVDDNFFVLDRINILVAVYTICLVRLRFYEFLEKLGKWFFILILIRYFIIGGLVSLILNLEIFWRIL